MDTSFGIENLTSGKDMPDDIGDCMTLETFLYENDMYFVIQLWLHIDFTLTELGTFIRTEFLCISVLRVASWPRVKLIGCKSALNPPPHNPDPDPPSGLLLY